MGSGSSKKNKTNNSGGSEETSGESTVKQREQKYVPPEDKHVPANPVGTSGQNQKPSKTDPEQKPAPINTNPGQESSPSLPEKNQDTAHKIADTKKPVPTEPVSAGGIGREGGSKESGMANTGKASNGKDSSGPGKGEQVAVETEQLIDEGPKEQQLFECALKSSCLLLKPDSVLKCATKNVTKLHLPRALPSHFSLTGLLNKLENLKDLDLSHNELGPQSFRAICLAMCYNSTILSLNIANNKSDTDSADCVGRLLEENNILQYLDVSGNYLGKDYFSRKVGGALKTNTALRTLRCESIGTTDTKVFIEGLIENSSLEDLDFSSNDVSDSTSFCRGIVTCLNKSDCKLKSLCLSRCELTSDGMDEIVKALEQNTSLVELNLTASQFQSSSKFLQFILSSCKHPALVNLSLDSVKVKSKDLGADFPPLEADSSLQVLSLSSCQLSDDFFTSMEKACKGRLLSLSEIDLTGNENLTPACINSLSSMTTGVENPSSLRKLRYGLNKGDNIAEKIQPELLPLLQYINLRMCKVSAESVGALGHCLNTSNLSTIVLDGLKISNTPALKLLLENSKGSKLSTLSLGGCSLDDNDLSPLAESIQSGLQLHMLKLSANRIADEGVGKLVDGLLKNKTHPLAVLDLSNNRITDAGVLSLKKLLTTKSHTSKLHSLNISSNNIGKEGLASMVTSIGGKSPLQTLFVQGQSSGLDEGEIVDVFTQLSKSLGYKVQQDGEKILAGCSDLPTNLPPGLLVNLSGLGGHTGSIGEALDSATILTDFKEHRMSRLALSDVMAICCFLKGLKTEKCVWSAKDWDMITGADRATTDTPSWLKLAAQRDLCVYLSNLPGNTTQQKVDAILEMEADCNLDETCLMKDPVTRSINGTGWTLLSDKESVKKAVDFYNLGEAKIFGQPFIISEVRIDVDSDTSAELEKQAILEREKRMKERAKEEAAHRTLIVNTAEESWKRHAYRLAHPAYADGRIW